MSISDAKIGIAELGNNLKSFQLDALKYFYFEPKNILTEKNTSALLPCYDEYTVAYSESRNLVLPENADSSATGNGIFKPIILSENEIVGTWRKIKKSPFVEMQAFTDKSVMSSKNIQDSIKSFNNFNQ